MNKLLALLALVFWSLLLVSNGTEYHQLVQDGDVSYDDHLTIKKTVFESYKGRSKRESPTRAPTNTTNHKDDHKYYTSSYIPPGQQSDSLWFELSDLVGSGASLNNNVTTAAIEEYHRYYQVWRLKFNFPFYGHMLNSVAVTTGGFLYTGTFFHDRIHLTQFIAPLLADFNPSLNDTAKIYVYNTVERFTVQWDEVHNHDHVNDGPFSFQVSIFPNGTIYFVYKEIPLSIDQIDNDNHPVVVGLADSFYVDTIEGIFLVRHIYEYSRILLNASKNLADSAYILTPIKNCVVGRSCQECTAITGEGNFDCVWCPFLGLCSDGIDRYRQLWYVTGCPERAISCPSLSSTTTTSTNFISSSAPSSLFNSQINFLKSNHNIPSSSPDIFISSVVINPTTTTTTTLSVLVSLSNFPSSFSTSSSFLALFLSSSNTLPTSSYTFSTFSTFSTSSYKFSTPTIIIVQPSVGARNDVPVGVSVSVAVIIFIIVLLLVISILILIVLKRSGSRFGRNIKQPHHSKGFAKHDIDGDMAIMDDTDDVEQDMTGLSIGTDL